MNDKLKYLGYSIVFQEVPDEVTLAINISGCPHHCEGCHSPSLWEYNGNYIADDLEQLIHQYDGLITCVCFMGGDQNQEELAELLSIVHKHRLKTALYSGLDSFYDLQYVNGYCDYIKVGHYDDKLGGLNKRTTNQIMFKYNGYTYQWDNITSLFWKEEKH